MKKLVIMTALVASSFVGFGGACNVSEPCPFGYRLRVMVRTTETCSRSEGCGPCGDKVTMKFRAPAIRRFVGLVYGTTPTVASSCGCSDVVGCECNSWNDAYIALYDYDTKLPYEATSAEFLQLNRVGCENTQRDKVELAFALTTKCEDATATMTFAGFGTCGNHDGNITIGSVGGYCAGLLPAGTYDDPGPCGDLGCIAGNNVWNLCDNTYFESKTTAAYGKWTFTWDSSIAAKVGTNLTAAEVKTGFGTTKPVKFNK